MDARIVVRMTETMGRGVFAARAIKAGEFLDDIFYTIEIAAPERERLKGATPSRFWFENDEDGTALIALGYVSLMNHSTTPNFQCCWDVAAEGQTVRLRALRDLTAGEQLFFDYRFDAGDDHPEWAKPSARS